MSLLGKIAGLAAPILSVVNPLAGAVAGIVGAIGTKAPVMTALPFFPPLPTIGRAILPGAGALVGGIAGAGVRSARAITNSAVTYCKRHPQWCSTIGGIAAIEAMIGQGQLPVIKRGRGRGISASDLRKFKRVSRVLSRYCAPTKRAMRAPAMRRGASCQ